VWGKTCTKIEDVVQVFVNYISGKIKKFPFCEGSLATETSEISDILVEMNKSKMFTINSQPKVNGAKSDDVKFGWGPAGGYVYQKQYIEFFLPHDLMEPLAKFLSNHSSITYQALNFKGEKFQNVNDDDVNAVTWGVFQNQEIKQPTVVDHRAFEIWKNEVFPIWMDTWAGIYKARTDKKLGEIPAEEESIAYL